MIFRSLSLVLIASSLAPLNLAMAATCQRVTEQLINVPKVEFSFSAQLEKTNNQFSGYKLSEAQLIAVDPAVQAYFRARNITKVHISEIKYYGGGTEVVAFFSYIDDPPSTGEFPNRSGLAATFYVRVRQQPDENGSRYMISAY